MFFFHKPSECHCADDNAIILEKRTLSQTIVGLLGTLFFVFVAGYYLGKRVASHEFLETIEQETFADRISHSLHTLYAPHKRSDDQKAAPEQDDQEEADASTELVGQAALAESTPDTTTVANTEQPQYVAHLLGGNLETTQKFSAQLKARGIETKLLKRESKTAGQNVVYWYQVVTERFTDKKKLENVVAQIKKIANLHDTKIVKI